MPFRLPNVDQPCSKLYFNLLKLIELNLEFSYYFLEIMDNYEQLPAPIDSISCEHLTLAAYPMFIAIGQLLFDKTFFFPATQYIKIYVISFTQFYQDFLKIVQQLSDESVGEFRQPFVTTCNWQIVKEDNNFFCVIKNCHDYQIKFDLCLFHQFSNQFKEIIFKPLCLPHLYSLHLRKFALFLNQNEKLYSPQKINQFTYETVESLMLPLFHHSQFLDRDYLVELIIRYKEVIIVFLKFHGIQSVQLSPSSPVSSP